MEADCLQYICIFSFAVCFEEGGGWRRWGRGRRQGEQVGGQQQWIKFTGLVRLWFGLKRADVVMRRTEQRWAEPRVKGALPLCQPCSPPTTRGSLCIASSTTHSPILCCCVGWWSSHRGNLPLCPKIIFIPSPVRWSPDSTARWRYAKNSIPLVWWCHEHFCRWFQSWLTGSMVQG